MFVASVKVSFETEKLSCALKSLVTFYESNMTLEDNSFIGGNSIKQSEVC